MFVEIAIALSARTSMRILAAKNAVNNNGGMLVDFEMSETEKHIIMQEESRRGLLAATGIPPTIYRGSQQATDRAILEYHNWYVNHIIENIHDWGLRLLFADWLEDHSNYYIDGVGFYILAQSQRWQAKEKKCPSTDFEMEEFDWWRASEKPVLPDDSLDWCCELPLCVFIDLRRPLRHNRCSWKSYPGDKLYLAETDLARSLERLGLIQG